MIALWSRFAKIVVLYFLKEVIFIYLYYAALV